MPGLICPEIGRATDTLHRGKLDQGVGIAVSREYEDMTLSLGGLQREPRIPPTTYGTCSYMMDKYIDLCATYGIY